MLLQKRYNLSFLLALVFCIALPAFLPEAEELMQIEVTSAAKKSQSLSKSAAALLRYYTGRHTPLRQPRFMGCAAGRIQSRSESVPQ